MMINNKLKDQSHIVPDIIDDNFAEAPPRDQIVDFDGKGHEKKLMIPYHPQGKVDSGGKVPIHPYAENFKKALYCQALSLYYGLLGIGEKRDDVLDLLCRFSGNIYRGHFIEDARKWAPKFYGEPNIENFENRMRLLFKDIPDVRKRRAYRKNSSDIDIFGPTVESLINTLQLLSNAQHRSENMYRRLYKDKRFKNANNRYENEKLSLQYTQGENKEFTMLDYTLMAFHSNQNPAWVYQSIWHYRYILEAATQLGHYWRTRQLKTNTISNYILHKAIELQNNSELNQHNNALNYLKLQMLNLIPKSGWIKLLNADLERFNLISSPPQNLSELIARAK